MATQTHTNGTDFEGRFRHHFPRRSNDFTLVVLKGHLLLEESVNHLLAALLRKPEAIESANLRFRQKLCLIRALAPEGAKRLEDPEGPGWLFRILDAVEKLNTIRNRLAHHLDHPQIEALVRDFLSLCEEPEDPDEPDEREAAPLIRRLKQSIVFVCTACEGISAVERRFREDEKKQRQQQWAAQSPMPLTPPPVHSSDP
jgi:hypothetical protein